MPGPFRPVRGFTLFEILLVLAITGALAMLAAPNFAPALASARLKAATRDMASALRQARSLAMRQRRDVRLTLDIQRHQYRVSGESRTHHVPEEIELKLFSADSEILSPERGSVRFFPDGSSTGGRITFSAGGREQFLDINWLTGQVLLRENES
jgi:general secretion pathway protein H